MFDRTVTLLPTYAERYLRFAKISVYGMWLLILKLYLIKFLSLHNIKLSLQIPILKNTCRADRCWAGVPFSSWTGVVGPHKWFVGYNSLIFASILFLKVLSASACLCALGTLFRFWQGWLLGVAPPRVFPSFLPIFSKGTVRKSCNFRRL